jgi:hypothetical protein
LGFNKKVPFVCLLAGLAFIAAGCDGDDLFDSAPGKYEGVVGTKVQGKVNQMLVNAEITSPGKHTLSVTISSVKGSGHWRFDLKAEKKDQVVLAGQTLKRSSPECFEKGPEPSRPDVKLCFARGQLLLDFVASEDTGGPLLIVLNKIDATRRPVMEQPAPYTAQQLFKRTMNQGFDSRVEFEHAVQAKYNAQSAAFALLPHLGAGSIMGAAVSGGVSWDSLFAAIGELVPFLFPNRWFKAFQASYTADAEKDAFVLMRADSANITEGLCYAIARDKQIIAKMRQNIASITVVRDEIRAKEDLRLIQINSSADITAIINSLEKAASLLEQNLIEEYGAVALAAGFHNPKAIIEVEADDSLKIEMPETIDTDSVYEVTLQRSYELRQMDSLIAAAKANEKASWFTWMDPAGSSAGNLGLGLYPFIMVANSQVKELKIKRESLQATLAHHILDILLDAKQALDQHRLAKEGQAIQAERMDRILANLHLGMNFSLSELASALQAQISSDIDLINAEFSYYVAFSKINRSLFAGGYADADPNLAVMGSNGSRASNRDSKL